jgi:hypothetical protein
MAQTLRNGRKDQPYRRASYWGNVLLSSRRFSEQQLFTAISDLTGDAEITLNSDTPLRIETPAAIVAAVQVRHCVNLLICLALFISNPPFSIPLHPELTPYISRFICNAFGLLCLRSMYLFTAMKIPRLREL